VLGHHLEIPPDVIGQHEDLKVGIIVLKFGGGDSIQAFSLDLSDQVLDISSFVIFGDHLVGFAFQVSTENAICVPIVLK